MKKYILFSFFLLLPLSKGLADSWEKVKIEKVLDNAHYKTSHGEILTPLGIEAPDFYDSRPHYQCQARYTTRLLREILENQTVLILKDVTEKDPSGRLPRHIKIEKLNLSEYLLGKGLASYKDDKVNTKYARTYKKAQESARDQQIGIWSQCGKKNKPDPYKLTTIWGKSFSRKYAPYLSPISVGKVEKVLSGDLIQLENGLKVRLLGIQTPKGDDPRPGFACFGKYSQKHLQKLIQGKTVFLEKDHQEMTERRELLRYVKIITHDKTQTEKIINQQMIEDGFARSFWPDEEDVKYQEDFEKAQKKLYENPQGAWGYCLYETIKPPEQEKIEIPQKLVYDPECPIKGNIAGSKKNPKKTYHTPLSGWYERLQYEACFENEEEAQKAGFTKVK